MAEHIRVCAGVVKMVPSGRSAARRRRWSKSSRKSGDSPPLMLFVVIGGMAVSGAVKSFNFLMDRPSYASSIKLPFMMLLWTVTHRVPASPINAHSAAVERYFIGNRARCWCREIMSIIFDGREER